MSTIGFYDSLSEDYDRFVNWPARLAFELPFFRTLFAEHNVRQVLDVACGTGQHAIALAKEGYVVTATDVSPAMVERANANAQAAGVPVRALALGFGELAAGLDTAFDAIICLGNSLPHVLTDDAMRDTLQDFTALLRPGGILVIQNRNFDRVMQKKERFMSPEVHQWEDGEWIFFRFYDFLSQDELQFNMVRLRRGQDGAWAPHINRTKLRPWHRDALERKLREADLPPLGVYGSYRGEDWNQEESGDLILVARHTPR